MASDKDFLDFVLDQLSETDFISYRAMMGEYVIYCRGKVVGGIYDNRLLLKPTASAKELIKDAAYELPYKDGGKMIAADVDDRELLNRLIPAIADDLSAPQQKSKR